MKEIVVISGKGGTGKTSLTASFAVLGGNEVVVADCDVDAADMHLLLQPETRQSEDFYSGQEARILAEKCTNCGLCASICRFDAIMVEDGQHRVSNLDCEGCGYCARVCPEDAIAMEDMNVGKWFVSQIRTGSIMVHARLGIGAENSGKMVAQVKNEARSIAKKQLIKMVLVDGSPGVGCPVISSLSGADYVVLVTEPTVSGLHDLKRVYQLVKKFHLKAGCIINKADLNEELTARIEHFLAEEQIDNIARVPYNEHFAQAITQGKTIVDLDDGNIAKIVKGSWQKIMQIINKENEK